MNTNRMVAMIVMTMACSNSGRDGDAGNTDGDGNIAGCTELTVVSQSDHDFQECLDDQNLFLRSGKSGSSTCVEWNEPTLDVAIGDTVCVDMSMKGEGNCLSADSILEVTPSDRPSTISCTFTDIYTLSEWFPDATNVTAWAEGKTGNTTSILWNIEIPLMVIENPRTVGSEDIGGEIWYEMVYDIPVPSAFSDMVWCGPKLCNETIVGFDIYSDECSAWFVGSDNCSP